jgi:multidrug efflux system membrane fusion protein
MKNHRMNYTISFILMIFLIIAGCGKNDSVQENSDATPVTVVSVKKELVSIPITTSGVLSSPLESKLSFKIGGIVEKIMVAEGESVRRGQTLAILNQSEIQAQLTQAKSGFEKAQRDFERIEKLYADSVVTLEQKQDAQTGLDVAQSNLEIARFNYQHSRIIAPTDGKILKRFAEPDEMIGPGTPVFIFGSTESQWIIRTGVTDRDVVRLAMKDSARVSFDAYPGQDFPAKVNEISQSADPMTGTYPLELRLKSHPAKLVSGLVAKVHIYPSSKTAVYLIPMESLVEADGNLGYVYLPNSEGIRAEKKKIQIVHLFVNAVAIKMDAGDSIDIVSEGSAYLSNGSKIEVAK